MLHICGCESPVQTLNRRACCTQLCARDPYCSYISLFLSSVLFGISVDTRALTFANVLSRLESQSKSQSNLQPESQVQTKIDVHPAQRPLSLHTSGQPNFHSHRDTSRQGHLKTIHCPTHMAAPHYSAAHLLQTMSTGSGAQGADVSAPLSPLAPPFHQHEIWQVEHFERPYSLSHDPFCRHHRSI